MGNVRWDDTVFVTLEVVSDTMAVGFVAPARTLGETGVVHVQAWGLIHGMILEGPKIVAEDFVSAGRIWITINGSIPQQPFTFLSIHQFDFGVLARDKFGEAQEVNPNLVNWGSRPANSSSGILSPPEFHGLPYIATPAPPDTNASGRPAAFTRQVALGYQVSCSVVLEDVAFLDSVILGQDNIDQCRQEYIDTQKAHLPLHTDFTNRWSAHFTYGELRSSDYVNYIINEDMLNRLEATRVQFGRPMTVLRAYSSPFRLFTYIPPPRYYVGLPTYWEGSPESPHLYGTAVDIQVDGGWVPPPTLDDNDWQLLATAFISNNLAVDSTLGRPKHVHAYLGISPSDTMVEVSIDPDSVMPGRQDTYAGHPPDIIRQFSIHGQISSALAPYTDGYLTLCVNEVPFSGGHLHPNRPMNHNPQPRIISGVQLQQNNGEYQAAYTDPCQWGGQYRARAWFVKNGEPHLAFDTTAVKVSGLEELSANPNYDLTGNWRPQHPGTHFLVEDYSGIPELIALRFDSIMADSFPGDPIPRIEVNDMSLTWGGRYDIGPPRPPGAPITEYLHWSYPHRTHRIGCGMDINYHGQNQNLTYYDEFLQACLEVWEEMSPIPPRPHEHPELNYNHIHFWFCQDSWE